MSTSTWWPQSPCRQTSSSHEHTRAGKARGRSSVGSYHLPLRVLPSSPERDLAPAPALSSASPRLFSRASSLLRGLCLHSRESVQLWFYPCQLFSAVFLLFVQMTFLEEMCSRMCSQDGEEQRRLYEGTGVGGMSSICASFALGFCRALCFL